jgi:hypothetical protein
MIRRDLPFFASPCSIVTKNTELHRVSGETGSGGMDAERTPPN